MIIQLIANFMPVTYDNAPNFNKSCVAAILVTILVLVLVSIALHINDDDEHNKHYKRADILAIILYVITILLLARVLYSGESRYVLLIISIGLSSVSLIALIVASAKR